MPILRRNPMKGNPWNGGVAWILFSTMIMNLKPYVEARLIGNRPRLRKNTVGSEVNLHSAILSEPQTAKHPEFVSQNTRRIFRLDDFIDASVEETPGNKEPKSPEENEKEEIDFWERILNNEGGGVFSMSLSMSDSN
jgi:hypothetical protein